MAQIVLIGMICVGIRKNVPIGKNMLASKHNNTGQAYISGQLRVANMGEIGTIIRHRRKELGYTQENIADYMGVSPRLIGDIERGKKTVGIQKILDYATGLGIDFTMQVRGK